MSGRPRWTVGAVLVALLLGLGAAPVGAQAPPPVRISPTVADPGGTVAVTGQFSFTCVPDLQVFLDGVLVATIQGPVQGPYATTFVIPGATQDGDHVVTASCGVPGAPNPVNANAGLTTPRTPTPTTTTGTRVTVGPPGSTTTTVEVIPTSPTSPTGPAQSTVPGGSGTTAPPDGATPGPAATSRPVPPTATDSIDVDRPTSPSTAPSGGSTTAPGATTAASGPTGTTTPAIPTVTTTPTAPRAEAAETATTTSPVGLALDRPAVAPGGDVTATGTGCRPGAPVAVTAADETVGRATADGAGGFLSALDTESLALGRHRLTVSCGTLLEADLDVVLAADVGGTGPSVALIWIVVLVAVALSQAHPWKHANRTRVR